MQIIFVARSNGKYPRSVYVHPSNPNCVVKIDENRIGNLREWKLWNIACKGLRKWLVPCINIYCNGRYLVMIRGKQPAKVPEEFENAIYENSQQIDDLSHSNNWVEINGRSLICDYDHSGINKRKW